MQTGKHVLTGHDPIVVLQLRAGLLPTPKRKAHISGLSPFCECCRNVVAFTHHILKECPRSYGAGIDRHTFLNNSLADYLLKLNYEVTHEPRVTHRLTFFKPDLVVIRKSRVGFIIDIAICNTNRHPDEVYKNKVDRYKNCIDFVKQRFGPHLVKVRALVYT